MPIAKVQTPDGNVLKIEVPEGASEKQVLEFVEKNYTPNMYGLQAQKQSWGKNALAGIGGSMKGLGLGLGQRLGITDQDTVDEHKEAMKWLEKAPGGTPGSITGNIIPAAATAAIPGANTWTGTALTSALYGAMQPTGKDDSVTQNMALATAGGMGGKYLGDKLGNWALSKYQQSKNAANTAKMKNSVRDQTIKEAQDAGYHVLPSQAGKKSIKESLSGKYKSNQAFGIENQKVTDKLAREALGIDQNTPLTPELMQNLRNQAFDRGYAPVKQLGTIKTDDEYVTALQKIVSTIDDTKKSFPGVNSGKDIESVVNEILVDQFDAGSALALIKHYREQATKAYRGGDTGLGKAYRDAVKAIEDQIERAMPDGQSLEAFRQARQYMAKTHTVENALDEATGVVDATKIGREFNKGKPLTGELKTIGKTNAAFPKTTKKPDAGDANPFTVFDAATAAVTAPAYYAATGSPLAMLGTLVPPAARALSRRSLLNSKVTPPSYDPSTMSQMLKGVLDDETIKALMKGAGMGGLLQAQ